MGCNRTVAAEQAARRAASGGPAPLERHLLGAADRRTVGPAAEGIRAADDLLQLESRGFGTASWPPSAKPTMAACR
jgi:hypothetical protein